MKNAFITIVKNHNRRTEIFNGFSFVAHRLDGDHFFLYETDDVESVKDKLFIYDKIYCTAICAGELIFIKKLIDKRWVLGGPIFRIFRDEYLKENLLEANIIKSSFEDYMGFERDDVFTPYWNDWLMKSNISGTIGYGASCGSSCYWEKCLFCLTTHHENDRRNITKVYNQLPEYDSPTYVHFSFGSTKAKDLNELIQCINQNKKRNSLFRVYIRGDEDIKEVIEKEKDLSSILFLIGLESFSQTTLNRIKKGTNIKTVLEIIKLIVERGATTEVTLISGIPSMYMEQTLKESLDSIDWIKSNIPPTTKMFFYDAGTVRWPNEDIAKTFGKYRVKNLSFGEDYYFKEKIIYSVLSKEEAYICSIPLNILQENGYIVNRREAVFYENGYINTL